ncbi:MAG: TIGR03746 family integrating conjugative element protein, partial [Candidatus Competibacteraceae bacterium]|nr:TIGR03746 family integrating conjugative element protein [Candidatus Competibacteraceae bacterium]
MRYWQALDSTKAHVQSLRLVIVVQLLIIGALWWGWHQAPERIRVYHPPDLRSGAVQPLGEVPPATIWAFAYYILQQLNHWPENGARDYGRQIFRLAPYLTPAFRFQLIADMELRGQRGELAARRRGIQVLAMAGYEERRVDIQGNGTWVAWLDMAIQETVQGMTVKQAPIRYPVRVVRYDVDPESNPWGLALDG